MAAASASAAAPQVERHQHWAYVPLAALTAAYPANNPEMLERSRARVQCLWYHLSGDQPQITDYAVYAKDADQKQPSIYFGPVFVWADERTQGKQVAILKYIVDTLGFESMRFELAEAENDLARVRSGYPSRHVYFLEWKYWNAEGFTTLARKFCENREYPANPAAPPRTHELYLNDFMQVGRPVYMEVAIDSFPIASGSDGAAELRSHIQKYYQATLAGPVRPANPAYAMARQEWEKIAARLNPTVNPDGSVTPAQLTKQQARDGVRPVEFYRFHPYFLEREFRMVEDQSLPIDPATGKKPEFPVPLLDRDLLDESCQNIYDLYLTGVNRLPLHQEAINQAKEDYTEHVQTKIKEYRHAGFSLRGFFLHETFNPAELLCIILHPPCIEFESENQAEMTFVKRTFNPDNQNFMRSFMAESKFVYLLPQEAERYGISHVEKGKKGAAAAAAEKIGAERINLTAFLQTADHKGVLCIDTQKQPLIAAYLNEHHKERAVASFNSRFALVFAANDIVDLLRHAAEQFSFPYFSMVDDLPAESITIHNVTELCGPGSTAHILKAAAGAKNAKNGGASKFALKSSVVIKAAAAAAASAKEDGAGGKKGGGRGRGGKSAGGKFSMSGKK